ncbi:UspA domain-containing protein [Meiothermus ruber DSM 1279]|uniref:UspA domain-containing protein n=1 Tax=Meiothermus ruber (strain ATCC 35948 / DSM 1279 / VKM B-1258 / 21) TaxID=504728 RepID=M9X9Y6_MEIRD|nr:UspA domain-containing protein [Meiothermus ruber DSM 1279]GAO76556.1 UspA domain-containing protein [Meiothermus ruber H328]
MFVLRHILVPAGLGVGSRAAVRYALELSRWLGCKITLLHVLERPEPLIVETLTRMAQGARHPPTVLLVEAQGQSIGAVVAQTAQQICADLIVIGRRDAAQQAPEGLGLVARSILASAKVPVQVVPNLVMAQRKPWLQRFADGVLEI